MEGKRNKCAPCGSSSWLSQAGILLLCLGHWSPVLQPPLPTPAGDSPYGECPGVEPHPPALLFCSFPLLGPSSFWIIWLLRLQKVSPPGLTPFSPVNLPKTFHYTMVCISLLFCPSREPWPIRNAPVCFIITLLSYFHEYCLNCYWSTEELLSSAFQSPKSSEVGVYLIPVSM